MFSKLLKNPLMEFQYPMIRKMWEHHYFINGDEMGCGKSLCALAIAVGTRLPTAVVCPAGLKYTWAAEIEKHLIYPDYKVLESGDYGQKHPEKIIIIPYTQLAKAYTDLIGRELIIADEVHFLKNIQAQRTKIFHDILDDINPQRFVGLSGSLIKNRVPELYSTLGLCAYNKLGTSGKDVLEDFSFTSFCQTFCYQKMKKFGHRKVFSYEGLRNEELLASYMQKKYMRRETDDVLGLPPRVFKDIVVSYRDDKKLNAAWEAHKAGKTGAHISSAKRAAAMATAPFTAGYAAELLEQTGSPVIITTDHPDVIKVIRSKLPKIEVGTIDGSTKPKDRQALVDRLQSGNLQILGVSIGAGSTGLTMTKSYNMVENDMPWVPEDLAQMRARIRRIGQTKTCVYHRIFGSKVGMKIAQQLEEKSEVIQRVKELSK